MQVRRARPPARGAVLSVALGLVVLPSLIPGGLGAGLPLGVPVVEAIPDVPAVAGRLLLVCHAGTAPVVVDTTALTGPLLRGWWVDGVTGRPSTGGQSRADRRSRCTPRTSVTRTPATGHS